MRGREGVATEADEDLGLPDPGKEEAERLRERDGDRGHEAGVDREEEGPAVEESPEGGEGLGEEDVLPSRPGEGGGQLAVTEGSGQRQEASEHPQSQEEPGRLQVARHDGGGEEDPRADHAPQDEGGGVEQAETANELTRARLRYGFEHAHASSEEGGG